ncbi:50S ribosomal protein L15 [Candidatus Parcubacteria bacterium]|nr:MAG: 50S ribosomal protein L15 [Candidatus Parcubacteria bacterium]
MLTLHNLENNKEAIHRRKRIGRGDGSGMGSYSTRGLKGQKARSGGKSGLAVKAIKGYLLRIPKIRGFKSLNSKMAVINVCDLDNNFKENQTVTAREMLKAGLIVTIENGVKVLSNGTVSKKFIVEANAFSKEAEAKITKAGGQAVIVGKKEETAKPAKKEDKKTKTK